MKENIHDKLIMFAIFIVYLVLLWTWLRVAPDPGWGDIGLAFLFIPILTTVIIYSLAWAFVLGLAMSALYLPVMWPSVAAGKTSFLELVMRFALLVALCLGAEIFKRYEEKKRERVAELARKLQALHELNNQLFIDSVRALAKILDARDPDTKNHSRRVAEEAANLAKKLGLSEEEVVKIRLAGELHDIGRVIIPDKILKKPGPLSATEFKVVKKHPETGFELLKSIRAFGDILPAVRYHHEHFNGKGYPQGLKGEEIPLMARIMAVADMYDALTSPRSHRGKLSHEEAANVMRNVTGVELDPHLVEVFLQPR